jgi:uncharacterized protein YdaT
MASADAIAIVNAIIQVGYSEYEDIPWTDEIREEIGRYVHDQPQRAVEIADLYAKPYVEAARKREADAWERDQANADARRRAHARQERRERVRKAIRRHGAAVRPIRPAAPAWQRPAVGSVLVGVRTPPPAGWRNPR